MLKADVIKHIAKLLKQNWSGKDEREKILLSASRLLLVVSADCKFVPKKNTQRS
jgi:hypothetical protein